MARVDYRALISCSSCCEEAFAALLPGEDEMAAMRSVMFFILVVSVPGAIMSMMSS